MPLRPVTRPILTGPPVACAWAWTGAAVGAAAGALVGGAGVAGWHAARTMTKLAANVAPALSPDQFVAGSCVTNRPSVSSGVRNGPWYLAAAWPTWRSLARRSSQLGPRR